MSAISPPDRRGWNVALIISICLNLVLAGIIAMAMYRFAWHQPVFPGTPPSSPERQQVHQIMSPRVLMRIAPDKTDALRAITRSHHDRLDALRAASLTARREVLRVYTSPGFDKAALDQALARMQQTDAAFETEMLHVTAETGSLLTPEERRKVIEPQPHGPGMRGGFGHHRGGPDGDDGPPPGH